MIAAAVEARISVTDFDFLGCLGGDVGDLALAAGTGTSAAGVVIVGACTGCGAGGAVSTLAGGTALARTLLGETALGTPVLVGIFSGAIDLGGTSVGATGFVGASLVFARGGSGVL